MSADQMPNVYSTIEPTRLEVITPPCMATSKEWEFRLCPPLRNLGKLSQPETPFELRRYELSFFEVRMHQGDGFFLTRDEYVTQALRHYCLSHEYRLHLDYRSDQSQWRVLVFKDFDQRAVSTAQTLALAARDMLAVLDTLWEMEPREPYFPKAYE